MSYITTENSRIYTVDSGRVDVTDSVEEPVLSGQKSTARTHDVHAADTAHQTLRERNGTNERTNARSFSSVYRARHLCRPNAVCADICTL